jgi:Ricin-type beta-trefoil lectin domain/Beta-galactosidase
MKLPPARRRSRTRGAGLKRTIPLLCGAVAAVVLGAYGALTGSTASAAPAPARQGAAPAAAPAAASAAWDGTLWATQLQFDNNGTAWSTASFTALKADGLNSVEIDLPWNTLEPSVNTYNFTELDQELANAAAAGIKVVPIFWQSGWGGSPASWIKSREVTAAGVQGDAPVWWDPTEQPEYMNYVTSTVKHIAANAGYGGSILDYGKLDAQWDINSGAGGWATADVNEFHATYLPQTFGTIATFNSRNGTSYTAFSQVPAAAPGQPLAGVYQAFRAWSVQTTYSQMASSVRAITSTPLYFYYGGHIGDGANYANNPDTFFKVAKQYNVTIIEDAANSPGLSLTFGSLSRAYGVKVAQEWTAPTDTSQMKAQAAQWVSMHAMDLPDNGGEDFFIHDGTTKDTIGWPVYTGFVKTLQGLSGAYPTQPAAVYIDYSLAYGNPSGGSLGAPENEISDLWFADQAGFQVVTSQEVANGAVSLSQFKAIWPLNGVDATLKSYQSGGGTLLTAGSQMSQYATSYATLANSGTLQTVPAVASSHTSASLTLAGVNPTAGYNGPVTVNPAGLSLNSGSYHLVDASSGAVLPQKATSNGGVCAAADVASGSLAEWNLVAGAIPSGTPVPSACGTTTSGGGGAVTSGLAGKCLDDFGNTGANGTKADLYDCNGGAAQNWTYTGGTLRANGACLDITGGTAATANGTLVQLWSCSGAANQQWTAQNGTLVNPASGKCLDDPALSTVNGTQLDIWTCGGGANQQWKLPAS